MAVLSAALLLIAFAGVAAAKDGCKEVSGSFTAVPPPACTSPLGICTRGTLTGDLPGTYDFVMETLQPVGDPQTATTFSYTGHSVITRSDNGAQLFGRDNGVMRVQSDGTARFVTVVTITRGTGQYQGASGGIVASGTQSLATGSASGTYTGLICTPADRDH